MNGWIKANGIKASWLDKGYGLVQVTVETSNGMTQQTHRIYTQSELRSKIADMCQTLPVGSHDIDTVVKQIGGK